MSTGPGHGCLLLRCNIFQTGTMSVLQLNALLTIALGIAETDKIPTLHIVELTQAGLQHQ